MRRIHFGLMIATLPVLALSFVLIGCGPNYGGKGEGKGTATTTGGAKTEQTKGPSTAKAIVAPAYDGTVKGKIVWKDSLTEADLNAKTAQYQLALAKGDKLHCMQLAPESERSQQEYLISGGKVGNVFVWLEPSERNSFLVVPDDQAKEKAGKTVELKQPYCAFHPRAFVLFPSYKDKDGKEKSTGQKLLIENNAKIPHNSKFKGGRNEGDTGLMGPGLSKQFVLKPSRDVVRFECNIHNWMRAYAWVFDHPYATVSKAEGDDFGTFEIAHAPVGVPLRLMAWHEGEGLLRTPEQPITLKAGDNPHDIDFLKKGE